MAHKNKPQAQEVDKKALSEFAYQKTVLDEGNEVKKPFGNRNYKRMKHLLMKRVSPSRYVHSLSVAKTARSLAKSYGYDERVARMAGLLHDWDKGLLPEQLAMRVSDYHLPIEKEIIDAMPWILHGPTAAAVLADQFPELGEEVFTAIKRHTVSVPHMSALDMIVFVADKIEPTHEVDEYKRLAKQVGKISLEDLFFEVQKAGLVYLIATNRPLTHEIIDVWNYYSARKRTYKGE